MRNWSGATTWLALVGLHWSIATLAAYDCERSLFMAAVQDSKLTFADFCTLVEKETERRRNIIRKQMTSIAAPDSLDEPSYGFRWDNKPDALVGFELPPQTRWHLPRYYEGDVSHYYFQVYGTGAVIAGQFGPEGFSIYWENSPQWRRGESVSYEAERRAKVRAESAFAQVDDYLPGYFFPDSQHGRRRKQLFFAHRAAADWLDRASLVDLREGRLISDSHAVRALPDLRLNLWNYHWIELQVSDLPRSREYLDTFVFTLNTLYRTLP